MTYAARKSSVLNRGIPPARFIDEMTSWARSAPDDIFTPRPCPRDANGNPLPDPDIFSAIVNELGPWPDLASRKAALLEVLRVLAGFESGWDWQEGVDTSRLGDSTPENSEAGAWQVSFDARNVAPELRDLLVAHGVNDGITFQRKMKFDHPLAMEFIARLLRNTRKHNGPLYKGDERLVIRRSLRGPEQSVYPWLSRDAMAEFKADLA